MAQITSYATLQTEISNWLNRSDLSSDIPTFIQLAEASLRRRLKTKHTQTATVSLTSAGAGDYTLPSAANVFDYHLFITSPVNYAGALESVRIDQLYDNRRANYNLTGRPVVFAIQDSNLHVSPAPDQDYTAILVYEGLAALSGSQTTNYVLDNYPDVYLYGALMEAAPFLQDDERVVLWERKFEKALRELAIAKDRLEFPNPVQRAPVNLAPISQIKGR